MPEIRFSAYVMEIRIQAAAFKAAYDRIMVLSDERRSLGEKMRAVREAGGPLPLEAERAQYADWATQMTGKVPRILEGLQSLLVAAGIISMLLWPDPRARPGVTSDQLARRAARGEYLRQVLEVSDDSPLKKLRSRATDPRGGMVHYDEMLEDFIGETVSGEIVTFQIGALSRLAGSGGWRPKETVRWFDDESHTVHVNGREIPLHPLLDEIRRIAGHIQVNAKEDIIRGSSPPGLSSFALGIRVDRD